MRLRMRWVIAGALVLCFGCGPDARRSSAVAASPKDSLATNEQATAVLKTSCTRCHERALPGRPTFASIADMTDDVSRRSLERVIDGTMPPDEPLPAREARVLGLALCARAGVGRSACEERYFGEIGPLIRTVAETLRTIESFAPKVPEANKEQRAAIEKIEEELRLQNPALRASARSDPTFVVLYSLLARERCAAVPEEGSRRSCEKKIMAVGLESLRSPSGDEE